MEHERVVGGVVRVVELHRDLGGLGDPRVDLARHLYHLGATLAPGHDTLEDFEVAEGRVVDQDLAELLQHRTVRCSGLVRLQSGDATEQGQHLLPFVEQLAHHLVRAFTAFCCLRFAHRHCYVPIHPRS